MTNNQKKIGFRVAEKRKEKRITQEQLADLTGGEISQKYITDLETGRNKNPSPDKLQAIAKALSCSESDLRYGGPDVQTAVDWAGFLVKLAKTVEQDAGFPLPPEFHVRFVEIGLEIGLKSGGYIPNDELGIKILKKNIKDAMQ